MSVVESIMSARWASTDNKLESLLQIITDRYKSTLFQGSGGRMWHGA